MIDGIGQRFEILADCLLILELAICVLSKERGSDAGESIGFQ